MKRWTRRAFAAWVGATGLGLFAPHVARSEARARVVVVGGGVGGATAARYLAASGTLAVTLVEPDPRYTTCFFSNHYLAGLCSLESLIHGYEALVQRHGITIVGDAAVAIDPAAKTINLASGVTLSYDRLVLAPGIAFKFGAIDGYDETATETMPHAWKAGPQTRLLRRQLESMEDGGVFVIVAPPDPYRCPPAPYERASLVAHHFRRHKPRAKILVLDAKDSFSGQSLFLDAWDRHYPSMIEWLPAEFTGGIRAVDLKARAVITAGETFKAAVANVIPAQMAGRLAQRAGLADRSGWCPVDPVTFESTLEPGIHLVGDAIVAGDMPKSAFSANSQAKACALAVAAALAGTPPPPPHLFNTCYTLLAPDDAWSNATVFAPGDGRIKATHTVMSRVGESAETRRKTARAAEGWYDAFVHDVFG